MRSWLGVFALAGCDGGSSFRDPGCLHRDLDDWCYHDESAGGPVDGAGACEPPGDGGERVACGDYEVVVSSGGFTSVSWYYARGTDELVAVMYGTDTNTYCGGFRYWYGQRVRCELEETSLPE